MNALAEACALAAGKVANIYTDSAYSYGVCHLFGTVWKQKGFKKMDGSPIQHLAQITDLMTAIMLPTRLAIVKCQAHKKDNMSIMRGNNVADEAAKAAADSKQALMAPMVTVQPHITLDNIADMQNRAPPNEKNLWEERGVLTDTHGLWPSHEGLLVVPVSLV